LIPFARFDGGILYDWAMRFLGRRMQGPQAASWEGLSAPRARNPLFRRISPLFRLQRRFSINTLTLQ